MAELDPATVMAGLDPATVMAGLDPAILFVPVPPMLPITTLYGACPHPGLAVLTAP
jgi:hypothetical protein